MAAHGWYPDPGGASGRYRYWDGTAWSAETTDDPADPAPNPYPSRHPRPSRPDRGIGTGFGVAVLVLVVVVVSAMLIMKRTGEQSGSGIHPATAESSSRSDGGWDDSSPIPSPAARSASPETDSSSPGIGGDQPDCTGGDPDRLAPHPGDGRLYGGRMSMMGVPDYSPSQPQYLLSWMVDTQGVDQETEPGWQSIFAVGEVLRSDGFEDTQAATRSSMQCALTNHWYYDVSSRKDIRNEAITIDGRPGWILTAEIRDNHPDLRVAGDQLTFVAVDDGRSDALSMWCGMVPLGDEARIALDQRVLASLKVES